MHKHFPRNSLLVRMHSTEKPRGPALVMLLNYFHRNDVKDKGCFLPEPKEGGEVPKEVVESVNASLVELQSTPPPKRKKATPHVYDAIRRADIGKYTAHQGLTAPDCSARHFSKVCGHKIPEYLPKRSLEMHIYELKR